MGPKQGEQAGSSEICGHTKTKTPAALRRKKDFEHSLENPGLKRLNFTLQQVGMLYVSLMSCISAEIGLDIWRLLHYPDFPKFHIYSIHRLLDGQPCVLA